MRNQLQKIIFVFLFSFFYQINLNAQTFIYPTFQVEIKNDVQTAPNIYEFDIYVKSTSFEFEQMGFQAGFFVNQSVMNGGFLRATIVAGNSDLVSAAQQTTSNLTMVGSGSTYGIKLTGTSVSGKGNGTLIGSVEKRICRIRITNRVSSTNATAVPFAVNSHMNLGWCFGASPWQTKLNAYVNSLDSNGDTIQVYDDNIEDFVNLWTLKEISIGNSASFKTTNLINPALNAPSGPAIANVTGGGSFCAGTTPTGVSVGLDASNASYSYQLLKGGVAEGLPVVGTGAALVWNNLPAGVYTVEATTTPAVAMAGSATVTETALPATPLVNVVNDCGTSTLTITNPEASATFLWTGGLTSNPINPTVGGIYTVTQTVGTCTSLPSADATAAPIPTPATPVASVMDNCGNSEFSISNLEVGASLAWFDGLGQVGTGNNYQVTSIVTLTAKQSKDGCTSLASNAVTSAPTVAVTPSVTIVESANNLCGSQSVTFTPTPVNGGVTPTYEWFVGAVSQGTSATFTYTPANGDNVMCIMTSALACVTSATATSNSVIMIVTTPMPISVGLNSNLNNVCAGTTVNFTALGTGGGAMPMYEFFVNNVSVQSGAMMSTYSYVPVNGDVVKCVFTSDMPCTSGNPATSNEVTMVINAPLTPAVAIAADLNNVCAGTTVTFTATPTNGGTPAYQWYVNTIAVGTGLATYAYVPANGDVVKCVMTSDLTCVTSATANSNEVTMIISAPLTPSVVIAADMNNVVAGTMVTFTATPTNGGAPMYQWYVNTLPVGTGLATYAYAPVNGDVVKCVMTSDLTCVTTATATSNEVTMIITVPGFITNTWLGNTTAWALATNWSLNLVPMANHNVVIPSGAANYPVILAPAVCNDIFLASGAQLINTNTLAIGGTVKVQQYLSANSWHFFSSPINNATAYTFSNVNPNNTGITMYLQKYNESWDGLSGTPWVDVAVGPAEVMSAGKGYEVWSNSNHTVTMEGTQLNSTDVTIPLTWTSPNALLKGYNLIGNPFPSALTVVSSNAWPMNNALAALYLWSAGSGNYLDWDGIGSGSINGIIPANQSFFVRATGPAATYTIPAAAKTFGGSFYKTTVSDRLVLTVNGNNYQDQTTVRFDVNATSNYDSQYDVVKLFGLTEAPQLYSVIQNENLSINALPSLSSPVVVPMGFNNGVAGTYSITASEMSSFANGTTIMLEDTKTNTFTNLMQQSVYTFTAVPADNVNRFNLHFGVNGINENNSGNVSIYSNNNVIYVNNTGKDQVKEIVVMNVLGQQIMSKEAANTTVNTITMDVASAYYIVKVITASKVYTEKVYVR